MRQSLRRLTIPFALGVLLASGRVAEAQPPVGSVSARPPDEDLYVYKAVPDVPIVRAEAAATHLSALWRDKPILLALVFSRCSGTCSPFLRSFKTAVSEAGGAGSAYRVLVLSFDPRDTADDVHRLGAGLDLTPDAGWMFGIAQPADIRRLADATGFWFRWDPSVQQYDHPSMVVAVDRGRVVRMLVGATVSGTQLSEVVQELGGKFVPAYALPGKVSFRCFEYDPASGRYSLDWGLLLLILPGTFAGAATMSVFYRPSSAHRAAATTIAEARSAE